MELKLYGSKARGDSGPESDVDLLVVLDHLPNWREKRRIYFLCLEIGLESDVVLQPVVFSRADIDSVRYSVTPLIRNVRAEGVTL